MEIFGKTRRERQGQQKREKLTLPFACVTLQVTFPCVTLKVSRFPYVTLQGTFSLRDITSSIFPCVTLPSPCCNAGNTSS